MSSEKLTGDIPFASASALAKLIRARKIGCLEVLDLYVERLERLNPRINAIVLTRIEQARAEARRRDQELLSGAELGPLWGVPMTVKESFDVPGLPTTFGLAEFKDNLVARPALAVERLEKAGGVIFGKTNVPVGLADWQTFNSLYGQTNNPWNVDRVPGGSSGGSAAALAAGLTALELGSDIGGSIRAPAHYCGIYGHKPTYRIAPRDGQALPGTYSEPDIDVIGPLARSSFDLELALNIIAGPRERDATAWSLHLPPAKAKPIADYRIGVMTSAACAEVDASVQNEIDAVARWLEQRGATVDRDVEPVDPALAFETYIMLLRAATSGRLTAETRSVLSRARESLDNQSDYYAWQLRGNTLSHWEWLKWDNLRHRMRGDWERFFEAYDIFLCPIAATVAFPHNQEGDRWERMIRVNGADQPSTTQMFWAGYPAMVFLPSTTVPIGQSSEEMPIGMQIVGRQYGDLTCLRLAQLLEREYRAFVPPPSFV